MCPHALLGDNIARDIWIALASEQGKTVVLTTHQLDMAQELCDRVAIMSKGHLLSVG
ncbi:MAG: hypothetical protein M1546_02655 [Chloroflexi bacterium]|nr:hypothetical protein [Chloroflexota bacterium]